MHNGFLRVAAAAPTVKVADVRFNLSQIKSKILELEKNGVELAVFPEMCITAYTCADLFHHRTEGTIVRPRHSLRRRTANPTFRRALQLRGISEKRKNRFGCKIIYPELQRVL